jgi:hypothetical protein
MWAAHDAHVMPSMASSIVDGEVRSALVTPPGYTR